MDPLNKGGSMKMKGRKLGRSHLKKLDNQLDQTREAEPSLQDSTHHFTGEFSLDLNLVKQEIGHNADVQFRELYLGNTGIRAAIIFINGLSDKELIDQS